MIDLLCCGFWSHDAPTSVAQARSDKAILPVWPNNRTSPIHAGYSAEFAPGTPMYTGQVAPQTGADGTVYPGGTEQVHIPDSWTHGSIVDQWPLN